MQETLRHKKAFEYYYGLGDKRSLMQVAHKFDVTVQAIGRWSVAHNWQKKVAERDKKNAEALAKATDKQIVSQDAKYIRIANAAIDVFGASLIGRITHTCECGQVIAIPIPKADISASDFAKLVATVKIVLGESTGDNEHIIQFVDIEPKDRKIVESEVVDNEIQNDT